MALKTDNQPKWQDVPLQRAAGLSLMELLAAVAVIGVLAALLFPVVGSAIQNSRNSQCVSHLRGIGMALHAYLNDSGGLYPPNRYQPEGERRPFPNEALAAYIPNPGTITERSQAGIWFCPADTNRPMGASTKSYGFARRLGSKDPGFAPWWVKPTAAERSWRLIYMLDHNLLRQPLSTAGSFSEKSWPLPTGSSPTPPPDGSGESVVDFKRHQGRANALMVDGSVQAMGFSELAGSRWQYVDPTR